MENRIREFRIKKGWSQVALAKAAGTSQQQIQRIEGGRQAVKLDLAVRICAALGVDLATVFPEAGRILSAAAKKGKANPDDLASDEKILRTLDAAGVDAGPYEWSIKVRMRGGVERSYSISSAETQRLRRNLEAVDEEAPFFVFSSGDREVMLNLTHLLYLHETFDVGVAERAEEEDGGCVLVYMANDPEPLYFDVEPDAGEPDGIGDIGQFRFIISMAQTLVGPNDFFQFEDVDGETAFLRACEIAVMEIPSWVLDPRLLGEEEEEVEEDGDWK